MRSLASFTPQRAEITLTRSRFIATLQRVDTEEAARATIARVRKEFADARHNCTAFIIGDSTSQAIARSSDDGEPAGTAGMPMLETLRGAQLGDVVAVVTRYFGGIKLGTGGLVRAYSQAVTSAIDTADLVELRPLEVVTLTVDLARAGQVEAALREAGALVVSCEWTHDLTLRLAGQAEELHRWEALARELTRGEARIVRGGTHVAEVPLE